MRRFAIYFLLNIISMPFLCASAEKSIRVIHQNSSGHAPERTWEGFKNFIHFGHIYVAVHRCDSPHLIISHNTFFRHPNGEFGYLEDYSLEQLKKLKHKSNGAIEKFYTLNDVFELVKNEERQGETEINIELRGKNTARLAAKLIKNYVNKGFPRHKFLVSSFNHKELQDFRTAAPYVPLGLSVPWSIWYYSQCCAQRAIPWKFCKKLNVQRISIPYALASEEIIEQFYKYGAVKAEPWVHDVTSEAQAIRMLNLGVTGVYLRAKD